MGEFLKQFGAAADSSAARSMKKFVAGRWEGEIVRLRFRLSGIRREVPMPNAKDLLERARMFEERAERASDPISRQHYREMAAHYRSLSVEHQELTSQPEHESAH